MPWAKCLHYVSTNVTLFVKNSSVIFQHCLPVTEKCKKDLGFRINKKDLIKMEGLSYDINIFIFLTNFSAVCILKRWCIWCLWCLCIVYLFPSLHQITAYGMFFLTLCLFKVSMSPSTNYAVYQSTGFLTKILIF